MPTTYELLCVGLTPEKGICPSGLLFLLRLPFWCFTCGTKHVVVRCGLKSAFGCAVSGASWNLFLCRPILAFQVTGMGLPGRSYKAIICWFLPVLNMDVCGVVP